MAAGAVGSRGRRLRGRHGGRERWWEGSRASVRASDGFIPFSSRTVFFDVLEKKPALRASPVGSRHTPQPTGRCCPSRILSYRAPSAATPRKPSHVPVAAAAPPILIPASSTPTHPRRQAYRCGGRRGRRPRPNAARSRHRTHACFGKKAATIVPRARDERRMSCYHTFCSTHQPGKKPNTNNAFITDLACLCHATRPRPCTATASLPAPGVVASQTIAGTCATPTDELR